MIDYAVEVAVVALVEAERDVEVEAVDRGRRYKNGVLRARLARSTLLEVKGAHVDPRVFG